MSSQDAKRASNRTAALRRQSRETEVLVVLDLDPDSPFAEIDSGIGFLDHMLTSLATHAGWRLLLACKGDLVVDDHHSAEDCALTLGEALARALAKGPKPRRFGAGLAPLDEALARAVIDLSGRAYCRAELDLSGARLGDLSGENVGHFMWSLASAAKMTLHVDILAGENSHHKAEASFKALALALKEACALATPTAPGAGDAAVSAAGSAGSGPESTKGAVTLEDIDAADWRKLKEELDGRG